MEKILSEINQNRQVLAKILENKNNNNKKQFEKWL